MCDPPCGPKCVHHRPISPTFCSMLTRDSLLARSTAQSIADEITTKTRELHLQTNINPAICSRIAFVWSMSSLADHLYDSLNKSTQGNTSNHRVSRYESSRRNPTPALVSTDFLLTLVVCSEKILNPPLFMCMVTVTGMMALRIANLVIFSILIWMT